jgi:uncharacterized protein (DUF924 family)
MADDLGAQASEVHDEAEAVLRFWFDEVPADKRFARDAVLDGTIAERFSGLRHRLLRTDAQGWRGSPRTLLAAVVVLDQFSRNIFRGKPDAYAGDGLALSLTEEALAHGWGEEMSVAERQFLYMPMMHAEDAVVQLKSLQHFTDLGDHDALRFAREHADVIARFARFPSRNAALGRVSTPVEEEYLSQPGAGW